MLKKAWPYFLIIFILFSSFFVYVVFFKANLPKSTIFTENITTNDWLELKNAMEKSEKSDVSFFIILPENKSSYPKNMAPPEFE